MAKVVLNILVVNQRIIIIGTFSLNLKKVPKRLVLFYFAAVHVHYFEILNFVYVTIIFELLSACSITVVWYLIK